MYWYNEINEEEEDDISLLAALVVDILEEGLYGYALPLDQDI